MRNFWRIASRSVVQKFGALGLSAAVLSGSGFAQAAHPLRSGAAVQAAPSNPQLVTAAIEKRVDDLLKRMTLEEKLGQLVQYNDTGHAGEADEFGANPETQDHIDAMQLAA